MRSGGILAVTETTQEAKHKKESQAAKGRTGLPSFFSMVLWILLKKRRY
jgi:hypothetical protein